MTGGERAYPLSDFSLEGVDTRFTDELVAEVALVLVEHGFPRPASRTDWVELQAVLFRFIYVGPVQ